MDEITCPYCNIDLKLDPTDCEETGVKYGYECNSCEKNFVFEVEYDPIYTASKADCLNGWEHDLIIDNNIGYSVYRCKDCDYRHIEKVKK